MPKMGFFRQPAGILHRNPAHSQEAKRFLKQQTVIHEDSCEAHQVKGSSAVGRAVRKLWYGLLTSLPLIPACSSSNDKVAAAGWITVGGIVTAMLCAIGIQAMVEKARSPKKPMEKDEPATSWPVDTE